MRPTPIENPLALDGPAVIAAGVVGAILVIGGLVASLVAFVVRYRSSDGDERQQLRWVGVSLGLAVPLFVVGALLWGVVPGAEVLPVLAFLALPAGIAVAVLKYRLYEIDLVVNRALVYGALTVGVVGRLRRRRRTGGRDAVVPRRPRRLARRDRRRRRLLPARCGRACSGSSIG